METTNTNAILFEIVLMFGMSADTVLPIAAIRSYGGHKIYYTIAVRKCLPFKFPLNSFNLSIYFVAKCELRNNGKYELI